MATVSSLLSEEQFQCSICLDMFTDPVSITCGHNFCKKCITQHWDINVQCQCPLCNRRFDSRPDLYVNTFIAEMAAQFRKCLDVKEASGGSSSKQQPAKPGEVLCDVCTETKVKALKSCLVCLTSYCENHLEPHQRITGLKRHQLISPVEDLEGRICKKHERPLELFCKTDQICVCHFCSDSDHKLHHIIPLEEEHEGQKVELGKTEVEVQQMIQERRLKIEDIKKSLKQSKEDAARATAATVEVFTALIQSVTDSSLAKLRNNIQETHNTTTNEAEGFIKELEEEILTLMKRSCELEQLSHTEDHLQFLQSLPSLKPAPVPRDWTQVRVQSSYGGTVRTAVAQLVETVSEEVNRKLHAVDELKNLQQYAADVTLDPNTANQYLLLSQDGKWVIHGNIIQRPPGPRKFVWYSVLGKESFSSGRFYYEVQVEGKTAWTLGVATKSVKRTGKKLSTHHGYWCVKLKGKQYKVPGSSAELRLWSKPRKVGIFVHYDEGLVSFYDVHTAALIFSFTGCNFRKSIYPYFNTGHNNGGENSAPLIICSVRPDD